MESLRICSDGYLIRRNCAECFFQPKRFSLHSQVPTNGSSCQQLRISRHGLLQASRLPQRFRTPNLIEYSLPISEKRQELNARQHQVFRHLHKLLAHTSLGRPSPSIASPAASPAPRNRAKPIQLESQGAPPACRIPSPSAQPHRPPLTSLSPQLRPATEPCRPGAPHA